MNYYAAPVRDLRFVLEEMLAHRSLALPGFEEATPDLVEAVLEEAAKLAGDVWGPLNSTGDRQGAKRHTDGSVTTPEALPPPIKRMWRAAGTVLACLKSWAGRTYPKWLPVRCRRCSTARTWR